MKTNELDKFVISASYHDLRAFAAAVYSDYIFAPHNRLIMKKLMQIESGEIKKLMINVSPRSGKSFISSELFPVWYLGRNPKDNIICSSYSQDIVEDFGRKVRNLMRDDIFSEIFNDIKLSEDSASVKKLSLNKGGSYYAVSAGSSLTGKGTSCLLIDDPHKGRSEVNSPVIRDKIINWYKSTAYTRLTPNGAVICISTRWHQQDLAGYLLETEGDDWDVINIPAINENGESYWPERWPIEKLNQIKKTIGSYEWSALYQQSPAPQEGGMFQYQWFEFVEALPKKRKCVRYWDRAATVAVKGNDPDYTVGIKLSKDNDGILYIEDMVRFRGSSLEVQTAIKNTASRDGTSCLVGLEQDPGQAGKAEMDNLIRTLQGFIARPYPVQKDKVTRAMPVSAQAEAGNIKILKAPWNSELLDELCTFPFAAHDDITDALSGAFGMLTSGYDMRDMVKL